VNYIPRSSWEYSYSTNQVIIAADVYVPGRTYRLIRHATETQRNMSGYVDVIGTNAAPPGVSATALISVSDFGRFSAGDSITISIPNQPPVTKTLSGSAGYTGFVLGADIATTLQNIATAFQLDPTFAGSGSTCQLSTVNANTLVFTAPGGIVGNGYSVQVNSVNTTFQIAQNFTGGADHTWIFDDLSGLGFVINDVVVADTTGYFSVWSTGNLDQGADANQYYRVAVEDDTYTGSVPGTITAQTGSNVLTSGLVLGAGWSGTNSIGYTHVVGTVGVMTDPTTYAVGSLYRIIYTIVNRTSGSVSLYAGGITVPPVISSGSTEVVFTKTDSLVVTPTQDFNGTITVAIEYLADNTDLGQELSLSVQITGTDAEGNSLQETLTLDAGNFCDIQNFRINNPYTNTRSVNIYNGISSWSIMSQANTGSSVLTVIAETASGTQNLFNLCDVNWNGDGVQWIRDQRNFVDATTNQPTSSVTAEALSSVAALMQIQYLTYQGIP
jgi:hypothetical protein